MDLKRLKFARLLILLMIIANGIALLLTLNSEYYVIDFSILILLNWLLSLLLFPLTRPK